MKNTLLLVTIVVACASFAFAGEDDHEWDGTPQAAFLNSEIVKSYQCTSCHTIGDHGGTVGPILNHIGIRRSEEWLRRWLADPQAVKPGTKMPTFDFPQDKLDLAVSYLLKMKKPLHTKEILNSDMNDVEQGRQLFQDYDCVACHRVGSEGRFVGPDLTWIGVRKTEDWEQTWLTNPEAFKKGTFMPNLHIPQEGVKALAAYLHTQKGQANEESQRWEFRTNFFLGNTDKERGELVFKRFGCWSCHGESAVGGIRNPNMAPDQTMPGLRKVGNDYTEETFAQRLKNKVVPKALDPAQPQPPFFCPDYGNFMNDSEMSDLYAYLKTFAPKKNKWRFK